MDSTYHRLEELFDQLGLPSDAGSIQFFIAQNSPLNNGTRLEDASFWTASQATFLYGKIQLDANWAGVVDQLNLAMRAEKLGASPHVAKNAILAMACPVTPIAGSLDHP
ncbi:DUF2789 family protein [Limnohabitans sp.]|jgi:hypothetical protein|uniref:DUF2789 family protein n=1 Tax=Limnohabitans sp. TaxID=1907725 RepID=UPI0037BE39A1